MSNNNAVGIVVHIKEKLQNDQIFHLEESLGSDKGVKDARINRDRSHFVLVNYFPSVTSSLEVLGNIKNKGYNAVLVGWI